MAAVPRAAATLRAAADGRARRRRRRAARALLEEVIREQAGPELRDALVTRAAAGRHAGQRLPPASSAQLAPLVRACSMRLALENVVDEVRRAARAWVGHPTRDPLLAALARRAQRRRWPLTRVDVRLVLTAHPTDMARRSVLTKQRTVGDALERLLERELGDPRAHAPRGRDP